MGGPEAVKTDMIVPLTGQSTEPRMRPSRIEPNDLALFARVADLGSFSRASARFVDLIAESFDLAIRMGDLRDDATLSARRIACFTLGLYASPAYLKKYGTPAKPDDLVAHGVLHVLSRTGDAMPWVLHHGDK